MPPPRPSADGHAQPLPVRGPGPRTLPGTATVAGPPDNPGPTLAPLGPDTTARAVGSGISVNSTTPHVLIVTTALPIDSHPPARALSLEPQVQGHLLRPPAHHQLHPHVVIGGGGHITTMPWPILDTATTGTSTVELLLSYHPHTRGGSGVVSLLTSINCCASMPGMLGPCQNRPDTNQTARPLPPLTRS